MNHNNVTFRFEIIIELIIALNLSDENWLFLFQDRFVSPFLGYFLMSAQ